MDGTPTHLSPYQTSSYYLYRMSVNLSGIRYYHRVMTELVDAGRATGRMTGPERSRAERLLRDQRGLVAQVREVSDLYHRALPNRAVPLTSEMLRRATAIQVAHPIVERSERNYVAMARLIDRAVPGGGRNRAGEEHLRSLEEYLARTPTRR